MRAHVWGCPVYVLDADLQDGKRVPKWNRRARMGQFLGFSRQHCSSLVGMVRNLRTGFVSPQYHLVFDDNYDTIYTESKSDEEIDNICQELFDNNCECYVEDEYDEDEQLVYKPPPLDEVWLSDDERRDRKEKLAQQRRPNELRERNLRDKIVSKDSSSSIPGLVSHDDDSSDEESLADDHLSQGGDVIS